MFLALCDKALHRDTYPQPPLYPQSFGTCSHGLVTTSDFGPLLSSHLIFTKVKGSATHLQHCTRLSHGSATTAAIRLLAVGLLPNAVCPPSVRRLSASMSWRIAQLRPHVHTV